MKIKIVLQIATILITALFINGCHTAEGFGKDLEKGGQAIREAVASSSNY